MDGDHTTPINAPQGPANLRIDKWLFFARLLKSRSLAAKAVSEGKVRINADKAPSPSKTVKPGDTLTLTHREHVQIIRVIACGTRRGPAPEAQLLYEDMSPPRPSKSTLPLDSLPAKRELGSGRPTKKQRRQTEQWLENAREP